MSARRIVAALLMLGMVGSGPGSVSAQSTEATPPRVSYISGEVSFWRPGAQDWAAAKLNMPLAPGDVLYTGGNGNAEVQIGPRAFVRAAEGTQIGLDNQEPDYIQFRVTGGYASVDLRELAAGQTVEIDTPNAAFTIERPGYYRLDVTQDATRFRTHRGGSATMAPVGGAPMPVAANQQIVVTGTETGRVEAGPAPQLTAWDRWNYQRTDALLQSPSARYVPPTVYGAEALDQHGSWRTVETYGAVWVPSAVAVGWVPYSAGHWIWDPRFGWTWLDDAPWGWAPYHYGRWVFVGSYWAWAPGPIIVRPVYSPALVVFFGGGVTVSFGRPFYWAPLGWGEPVIPWWGRPGFIGVASWQGWGGPRIVNNVVINRSTTVNVTNITVYQNVNVTNAVVGVPADRFGRGPVRVTRIEPAQVRQLTPVRGALEVTPVATSLSPSISATVRPPAALRERAVVATRPPHDARPALRAQGLAAPTESAPAPTSKLTPSPRAVAPGAAPAQSPSSTAPPGEQPESKKEKRAATPPPAPQPAPPAPPSAPAAPEQKKAKQPTPEVSVPRPASPASPSAPAAAPEQKKDKPPQPGPPAPPAPPTPPAAQEQKKDKPPRPASAAPPSPPAAAPEQKKDKPPRPASPAPPSSPAAQEQKKDVPGPPSQPPPGQGGPGQR